ncbi:hypothetical protein Xvie_03038 [Xenorhabdus vietnamensis]|uniref:Uncharacterized protein n=2 Tax=Xenorhabdus vietnamensis TaxID=351656 RepID=A0A1Y2SCH0_9GAMM|nr:hypothetical protein Xvie_03038 [Xenorhabdus vietnamensis]
MRSHSITLSYPIIAGDSLSLRSPITVVLTLAGHSAKLFAQFQSEKYFADYTLAENLADGYANIFGHLSNPLKYSQAANMQSGHNLCVSLSDAQKEKDSTANATLWDHASLRHEINQSVIRNPNLVYEELQQLKRLPSLRGLVSYCSVNLPSLRGGVNHVNNFALVNHWAYCRLVQDFNSTHGNKVQIFGVHKLFNSCLIAIVLSLYSALSASNSAINDSYLARIPFETNKLTALFISSGLFNSAGKITLVLPVINAAICLQKVFAGQLHDIPICPETSKTSTSYVSSLLLLNAEKLNVIAVSFRVLIVGVYFFFCDFCLDNFLSQASITHDEKLEFTCADFSLSILALISSINSCGNRICFLADLLFISPVAIGIHPLSDISVNTPYIILRLKKSIDVGSHLHVRWVHTKIYYDTKIATPRSAANTIEASNHNVKESYAMDTPQHNQTRLKFTFLIASGTQRLVDIHPVRLITVLADSEGEARLLVGIPSLIFVSRQEVVA